ncbi:hypothetical protein Golax_010214 [Gossypium laxum]|uniref:DUF3741 domain-containing protein n=1 Tax=Gossypium laxum TaxID=34288 RepID=A0A7J8ZGJ7_9ROSI|nr:hypothetical protein [Gossypium laxum]
MANTSDFVQKLLDELRLRKERMAASKATNPMAAADHAYAYSKTGYKSSREPNTLKTIGCRAGNSQNRPKGGRRPVSNQIVPFGRGQKSVVLDFALENGGRRDSTSNSSMFNFLHKIGRKQMDYGKMARRDSKLPDISHLRIEDISRGVQKLNQILRACSNGLKFDTYSIQIGQELLKVAMDLEESLRMLVNLQEDSKYSITQWRRSRITLLEEEEDGHDEKQLDIMPRFLGIHSRNYNDIQGAARTDLKLRLKHPTYSSSQVTDSKHGKKVVTASVGSVTDTKTLVTFSEQNNLSSLQCKQEKLRIPNVIAKLMGLHQLPRSVDSKVTTTKESGKQPGKVLPNRNGSTRVAVHDKLPPRKDLEDIKSMMSSRKAFIKMGKQQSDIIPLNQNTLHRGNRYANKLLGGDQQKLQINHGFEQVSMLRKSELQERRRQLEERKERSKKQKLLGKQKLNEPMSGATATNSRKKQPRINQATASRKSSKDHIDATHFNGFQDGKHHKNQAKIRSSTNFLAQTILKAGSTKGYKLEVPRTNEVITEKGASVYNLSRTPKNLSSILQERKQTRLEKLAVPRQPVQTKGSRFEEVEPKVIRSNKYIARVQSSSVPQEMQKAAKQGSVLCCHVEDECKNRNKPQALVEDSDQISVSMVTNEQQDREPDFERSEERKFKSIASDPLQGTDEANTYEKPHNQSTYASKMPQPLTESENHLKQILMKSQLFTNTTEALFKLDIPIGILHGNVHNYNEQESKLLLDCGYEVMKRRGRRQELSAHPFLQVSISSSTSNKAKSLDDLVKPMCKDFDKLKSYGREGKEDCSFEDYLPKMIEVDVNNKEADLNCMWELGWNCMMFALEKDDIVRDVEKYVLNGLLVGITRDLFTPISVSA